MLFSLTPSRNYDHSDLKSNVVFSGWSCCTEGGCLGGRHSPAADNPGREAREGEHQVYCPDIEGEKYPVLYSVHLYSVLLSAWARCWTRRSVASPVTPAPPPSWTRCSRPWRPWPPAPSLRPGKQPIGHAGNSQSLRDQ